jgi:hypothetical protein
VEKVEPLETDIDVVLGDLGGVNLLHGDLGEVLDVALMNSPMGSFSIFTFFCGLRPSWYFSLKTQYPLSRPLTLGFNRSTGTSSATAGMTTAQRRPP